MPATLSFTLHTLSFTLLLPLPLPPIPMIVLSETSDPLPDSAGRDNLHTATAIAKIYGFAVYHIPPDLAAGQTAAHALAHIPPSSDCTPGLWLGNIPSPERYRAIYNAAQNKGIWLLNSPDQHRTIQEFDQAYPHLHGLTPHSIVITDSAQCRAAIAQLGLPVFVRGAVQSRKRQGWDACVATTLDQAERLSEQLLRQLPDYSRGRVLLRQLVNLRHDGRSPGGFPLGREYRVFVYQQTVLTYAYSWELDAPLKFLDVPDETDMLALALAAARRLDAPYVAIDVAQLDDGRWTVIETSDPQFSGSSQVPQLQFWNAIASLSDQLERGSPTPALPIPDHPIENSQKIL